MHEHKEDGNQSFHSQIYCGPGIAIFHHIKQIIFKYLVLNGHIFNFGVNTRASRLHICAFPVHKVNHLKRVIWL